MIGSVKLNSVNLNPYLSFKANAQNTANVSNPIAVNYETKGMEALANYNKAILIKQSQSEKFTDVFEEMQANIPDSTSTIEEKELALSYINRMLNCKDITPELRNYWSNKKDIIEMEIQTIINEKNQGSDFNNVAEEWSKCVEEYWSKKPVFENVPERVEYYQSYYNMYISFCDRVLSCESLSDEKRMEWIKMRESALFDLKNHREDLNRYYNENN